MEQYLWWTFFSDNSGRPKNGDRSDNRIENLELWGTSQPKGQNILDKVEWAKEILSLYESELDKLEQLNDW